MKRLLLLAIVTMIGLTGSPTFAQEQPGWAHRLFSPDGKGVLEHDFGTVPKGAMLPFQFKLNNPYKVPLAISTRVSCDCLAVTTSKPVLQSTESGVLDIVMDTRRFNGPKVVTVFFTVVHQPSQAMPQYFTSTALLTIKANCRTDVTLNPGAVNFGIVPRGQTSQAAVDVDYAGALNWQVTGIAPNELFNVGLAEKYRRPGQVGYRVSLALKPDAPAGSYKQELMLATNDPVSPTVPVPFEITVQPPLLVSPETLRLSGARVASESSTRFTVRSGGKPFRIIEVEGLGDGLTLGEPIPTTEPRPVHTLSLKWTPASAGAVQRKITFKTDTGATATAVFDGSAN